MADSRRRINEFEHKRLQNEHSRASNVNLVNQVTQATLTNSKLDTFSGHPNNNIGMGQTKLQVFPYAHDTAAGNMRPLQTDANGRLLVDAPDIEVKADTINLSVDTLEAKTQAITDKLDSFAGAGNNNVGEGSSKLQTYLYARDVSAGNFKPLVCDGDAHLQVDVLSTALPAGGATEATLLAAKNALFTNPAGSGNTAGENLSALNSNLISMNNKFVGGQTTSGMATAQNQQVVDITLQGIDTTLGDTQTIHTATNTKLDSLITSNAAIKTAVEILDNVVSGSEAQVDIVSSALPTGAATESTLSAAEVHLGNIETAVQLLDNIVSGSEAQCDIVSSALPTGASTEATLSAAEVHLGNIETAVQLIDDTIGTDGSTGPTKCVSIGATESGGNIQELLCDGNGRLSIDVNSAPTTAVTNSGLTELAAAINSDRVDVNIANGGFNGAVTNAGTFAVQVDGNALTSLQLIDDVVKAEDAAHSNGDKGLHVLSVRKDTATALAGSDADYQSLITGSAGHLHINDSLHHRVKDVAFMTNEDISATSYSTSILDTEGYTRIQIMGEMNSGSVSGNSLMIEGSNASSGTYYHLGYLTNTTMGGVGGRTQFLDHDTSNGFGGRLYPRYLKIFNKTSGTINATLRAVMTDFKTYI